MTNTRRVDIIGKNMSWSTLDEVKESDCFPFALDETNDINDTAQLAIFVRYSLINKYHERLLTVLSLKGRVTGSIILE